MLFLFGLENCVILAMHHCRLKNVKLNINHSIIIIIIIIIIKVFKLSFFFIDTLHDLFSLACEIAVEHTH